MYPIAQFFPAPSHYCLNLGFTRIARLTRILKTPPPQSARRSSGLANYLVKPTIECRCDCTKCNCFSDRLRDMIYLS